MSWELKQKRKNEVKKMKETICELYHDNFQNFKRYNIKKPQLVIADIPYNTGENAYGSNPQWYEGGDNKNGESKLAKSSFFNGDGDFKIAEYMHFCNRLLIKEPKEKGKAPAMTYFQALANSDKSIMSMRQKLAEYDSRLKRFKGAYDSLEEKLNAQKKQMEALKYELSARDL